MAADGPARRRRVRRTLVASLLGGIGGALAMIPPGLLLSAHGLEVNRYGRLTARLLAGTEAPALLMVLHLVIGVISAVPLAAFWACAPPRRSRSPVLVGAAYGAAYWMVVNAMALPWLFGQPHPWADGPSGMWPSATVHVIYGAVAGIVVAAVTARGRVAATGPTEPPDGPPPAGAG